MTIHNVIIAVNNRITRWRRVRVPGASILLLLPHCLHRDTCPRNVTLDPDECRRCGQCSVASMLALRDEFGLACSVVGGGRQALAATRQPHIKAVVAVACQKELVLGIRAAFPKPVVAIPNMTPDGPCRNTCADYETVRRAISSIVAPS